MEAFTTGYADGFTPGRLSAGMGISYVSATFLLDDLFLAKVIGPCITDLDPRAILVPDYAGAKLYVIKYLSLTSKEEIPQ